MARARRQRLTIELALARERVGRESPFSPSWDAAMAGLEDLEQQMLRLMSEASP
jgi:hypothetical protein